VVRGFFIYFLLLFFLSAGRVLEVFKNPNPQPTPPYMGIPFFDPSAKKINENRSSAERGGSACFCTPLLIIRELCVVTKIQNMHDHPFKLFVFLVTIIHNPKEMTVQNVLLDLV
jgi:hypothetical protein